MTPLGWLGRKTSTQTFGRVADRWAGGQEFKTCMGHNFPLDCDDLEEHGSSVVIAVWSRPVYWYLHHSRWPIQYGLQYGMVLSKIKKKHIRLGSQKKKTKYLLSGSVWCTTGLGGSVGCAVRLETRRLRVQPPLRSATFFRGDWSWNIFYGHSLTSADSRRAVVSFWQKNVHNTG